MLPLTFTMFDPFSSTENLVPTSRVCTGDVFAIPTLEFVTKPVVGLVNWTVLDVTFPLSVTDCKSVTIPVKFEPSPIK